MANIYGIIGLLFAAPLAAAIQIIVTRLLQQPSPIAEVLPQHSSIQTYDLQTRLQSVQKTIAQQDESPRPEILTLVERLTKLIERANEEI